MAVRHPPAIYVVSPGGRNATGGICRMVDNYMTEWEQRERRPPLVLVDSYGNKGKGYMPAYFASAFWCVLYNGLCGRIGLLHLHMAECGSVLRKGMLIWLARLLRVPTVVHVHAAEFVDFYAALPRVLQRLVSATLRCATRCIVLGTTYREYFINVVALDPRRVEIVFNGVPDPDVQRPEPRRATCELLFAGVLNERKGLQDLLTALASERLRQAPWHLSIAGNGDDAPFRKQSEMSGLADKVTFLGWLPPPKMHDLFAASDVLVLPSRNEGLPMVIVEAMASGLAVISTPVGSIGDAVLEGVNGLLVPPKDVDALATALATVIEDPEVRRRMGREGRDLYLRKFMISGSNQRLSEIFSSVHR
jgi:glycosyltransferase involved in cell wall biosynthesis